MIRSTRTTEFERTWPVQDQPVEKSRAQQTSLAEESRGKKRQRDATAPYLFFSSGKRRPMRAILLHNPAAGFGDHSRDTILSALRLAGLLTFYYSVKNDDFAAALHRTVELVVVAGGDGTVAKVIAQMPDRSIPVVILPLGTANNIARSLGIAGASLEMVEELLECGNTQSLNIGSAQGPWGHRRFVEAAGPGALAQAIQKPRDGKSIGGDRLQMGRRRLQELLYRHEVLNVEVVVDGKALPGDILAVEVLNVPYTGPALPLAPRADPREGIFDIVCISSRRRSDMTSWLDAPHQSPPPVVFERGRKVVITGDIPYQRVDDAVFDPGHERATIIIEPKYEAARILVPK
jgi:diacylglycerol kinase (ATP)